MAWSSKTYYKTDGEQHDASVRTSTLCINREHQNLTSTSVSNKHGASVQTSSAQPPIINLLDHYDVKDEQVSY